jgi:hypothetical protein
MPDVTRPSSTTTLIAYGSLMTGLGLERVAPLPVADARRVRLLDCRRGLGKLSQHGDRLAMVLEPRHADAPIHAELVGPDTPAAGAADGIAFDVALDDLARIGDREGYPAAATAALAEAAARAGTDLAGWLWHLADEAGHDVARYRRSLFASAGRTSPHYVPHPVPVADLGHAVAFVPPGREGSGSEAVVPIRVQTAMDQVLTVREAWRVKPTASQLDYLASCLLAEVHNVSLADVVADLADYPPLARLVRARLTAEAPAERERFRAVLGLTPGRYAARFPSEPRRASFLP